MRYEKTGIKGKGVWIFDNGNILCYRHGNIVLFDSNYHHIKTIKLPMQPIYRIASWNRYLERIGHHEPRFVIDIDENTMLVQLGRQMLNFNLRDNTFKNESLIMKSRPLSAHKIANVEGFNNSIVIGDYGGNPKRERVNIYQRSLVADDWKIVYSFEAGTIRHIHGFSSDAYRNCVYIMTGDEDGESGIWKATDNFKHVEKFLVGKQQYRACQMFVTSDSIYYCTDAPSEPNFLYRYRNGELKRIKSLRGTCIYGVNTPKGFLCSTTCEPDVDTDKNIIYKMLNRKPGKGIIGRNVDVLFIEAGQVKMIRNYKNDALPLRLMQYGTVLFSNYNNGKVLCTPVAVKKYDFQCYVFSVTMD